MKSFLKSTAGFCIITGANIATLFFLLIVSDNTIPDSIQKGILLISSGILLLAEVVIFAMKQNEDLQMIRPYCVAGNIIVEIGLLWLISVVVWGTLPHVVPEIIIGVAFVWLVVGAVKNDIEVEKKRKLKKSGR